MLKLPLKLENVNDHEMRSNIPAISYSSNLDNNTV